MVKHTFPLVEVRGNAYEMGRQHGAQAADLIRRYLLLIERLARKPRTELTRSAMRLLPQIEALSPLLVEEVRGLAEGSGIPFAEAVLCQVRLEAAEPWPEGCTAFALRGEATADGDVLVGQNQDLRPEYEEVSILLRVQPSDGRPKALIYTFAGQLGYFGMNEYGVCNYANALGHFTWRPGLSRYALKRGFLEQKRVADCIALAGSSVCSAENVILADGEGNIGDIEFRPEGIALYGGEHPDAIIHTNHYLSAKFKHLSAEPRADSLGRLNRMTGLVREHWGRITVDVLKEILSDHDGDPAGICRHGYEGVHTTSGHIAEPTKGLLHIRTGHGCLGSWETYHI